MGVQMQFPYFGRPAYFLEVATFAALVTHSILGWTLLLLMRWGLSTPPTGGLWGFLTLI